MTEIVDAGPLVLVLHGPSLQLLGTREPELYGPRTLAEVDQAIEVRAQQLGARVACFQSNHEGVLIDRILGAREQGARGILINPAAYTHTSLAIGDAIRAVSLPAVEVHLSNVMARDQLRRRSLVAPACVAVVAGFGAWSYVLGLEGLVARLAPGGTED